LKYWDSSALIPLFVAEKSSKLLRKTYAEDTAVLSWTLSDIEVGSALSRLLRERAASREDLETAASSFEAFWKGVHVVALVDAVKTRARRLLRLHPLTAADALQLAAALVSVEDDPRRFALVSLDERLRGAGEREGFRLIP
jgi:hypothetical protein